MKTIKMTVAQALVKFLDNQYISFDGEENKFIEHFFTIFGHGIALGLGEALDSDDHCLRVMQGRNEQGMCHVAIGFSKQLNRRKIIPCASSVGPGAANMVTAAATATVNNIPLLLFPADTYASRQPDPVLQQLEKSEDLTITTNDAFRPVCKYWDRITRPEQLMSAMINAMRVLSDPAETGAVCISLPQDCEAEAYEYPESFFQKRVHRITRPIPVKEEIEDLVKSISSSKKPIVIVGGGVRYSEAGLNIERFCETFHIPFAETQAGKSACQSSHSLCLGGIGTTGTLAANKIAKDADCIIAIGTRLSDFTTSSKWQFQNPNMKMVTINISRYHAYKMDATIAVGDAKETIKIIHEELKKRNYKSSYKDEVKVVKEEWEKEIRRLKNYYYDEDFEPIIKARDPRTIDEFVALTNGMITQTAAILTIRDEIDDNAILVTAGGSLPSDLQRIWTTNKRGGYHAEYGYSCMGYECEAVMGVKMAEPDVEAYTLVGDGSFQMLHSEMATAMQEGIKVNILVFDNCGFGCINNLEMTHGVGSLATEFRYRDEKNKLLGKLIPVDYAKIGEGYGFTTYTVKTLEELKWAIRDAKKQKNSILIDIKVIPKTMSDGYDSWWNVGQPEISKNKKVEECWENDIKVNRAKARKY